MAIPDFCLFAALVTVIVLTGSLIIHTGVSGAAQALCSSAKRDYIGYFFFFLTLQILLPISSAADKRLAACSVGDVPACTIPPRTFFSFVLALARAQKADRAVHWPLHRAGAVGTAWALPAPAQFAASEILTSPRTPPKCWIPS